ncbi:MAG TPA: phage holin family protein, partial [Candidatus Binatia bacterium]|nr:phage holin family protein [Candidatus Binatia bacterium]
SQQAFVAQFELLRVEATEDLTRTLYGSAILIAGLLVVATAWVAFMVLAVHLLSSPLSLAASLGVVGGFNAVVGVGLLLASVRTLRRLRLLKPDADSESPSPSTNSLLGPTIPEQRETVLPVVEHSGRELRRTLHDLVSTVNSRLDLSKPIVERPVPWLVGSLLAGFLLGHPRAR